MGDENLCENLSSTQGSSLTTGRRATIHSTAWGPRRPRVTVSSEDLKLRASKYRLNLQSLCSAKDTRSSSVPSVGASTLTAIGMDLPEHNGLKWMWRHR